MSFLDCIYYINLDKDTHRKQSIINEIRKVNIYNNIPVKRVSGILYGTDGCPDNMKKYLSIFTPVLSKSSVGCGLSHIKTWENVVKNNHRHALILEDDAIINENITENINKWINEVPKDFDIIFLGCSIGCESNKKYSGFYSIVRMLNLNNMVKVKKISENVFIPSLPLDLHGYIISNKCARKFLDIFESYKLRSHIDMQLLNHYKDFNVYAFNKKLVNQQLKTSLKSNNTDSYPALLIKLASKIKGSDGADLSYQLSISGAEIFGVGINLFVYLFFIFGMFFNDLKTLTMVFFSYNALEILYSKKINTFHIIVYYIACVLGFYLKKCFINFK
jgi:GR25 family glycosyltransferase involved in LPS biosynthesis